MNIRMIGFALLAFYFLYAFSGCTDNSDRVEIAKIPSGLVCKVSGKEVIVTHDQYDDRVFVHYTNENLSTGIKSKALRMWVSKSLLEC